MEEFTHYKNEMVMECVEMAMHLNKSDSMNKTEEEYIIEYIDCKMAHEIEKCVKGKLTCSTDEAKKLAHDLIWAITDSICFDGILWFWINIGIGIGFGILGLVFLICLIVMCCKKKKAAKVQNDLNATMRRPRNLNRTLTGGILENIEKTEE